MDKMELYFPLLSFQFLLFTKLEIKLIKLKSIRLYTQYAAKIMQYVIYDRKNGSLVLQAQF